MKITRFLSQLFVLFFAVLAISPGAIAASKYVSLVPDARMHAGMIVIRAQQRFLYFVIDSEHAIRYPIAVPKSGKEWSGYAHIEGKYEAPAWAPPAEVKHDHPELPDYIPGGAPNNPMGAAAMTLDRGQYAIHGTTQKMRGSIGSAASYGCIRMYNEDVADLFSRVSVGTEVLMIR